MIRRIVVLGGLIALLSCGGKSPTQPSGPPAPSTFTLSGRVTSVTGSPISGASVRVMDGVNAGKTGTSDSGGAYSLPGLQPSGFTATASATNYISESRGVNLVSNQVVDFPLTPVPPFSRSGVGDTVFDLPSTITRIRITAVYTRASSNFIVKIAGRLIVNELLGTFWNQTSFSGTYLIAGGGVVEITDSSGVAWSFTEVR